MTNPDLPTILDRLATKYLDSPHHATNLAKRLREAAEALRARQQAG